MKIAFSFYELEYNHPQNNPSHFPKREGALLKINFGHGKIGYADCHAWPELGDLSIQEQLKKLSQGESTSITNCALEFAAIDAENRFQRKSIFDSISIPKSHFLVTSLFDLTFQHLEYLTHKGYTHIKVKVGNQVERELEAIQSLFPLSSLKLRLDFNEKMTSDSFFQFLKKLKNIKHKIDFIEDPFPFDVKEWEKIQKEEWTLACDRQAHLAYSYPESAQILVIKPALNSFEEWKNWNDRTCIVTSYLGHPLGQVAAAYFATKVDPHCANQHGLLSHHVYQPTEFSQELNWDNPQFILPQGMGCGFDNLLEKQNWIAI